MHTIKVAEANHHLGMSQGSFRLSNDLDTTSQNGCDKVHNKSICITLMEFSA